MNNSDDKFFATFPTYDQQLPQPPTFFWLVFQNVRQAGRIAVSIGLAMVIYMLFSWLPNIIAFIATCAELVGAV